MLTTSPCDHMCYVRSRVYFALSSLATLEPLGDGAQVLSLRRQVKRRVYESREPPEEGPQWKARWDVGGRRGRCGRSGFRTRLEWEKVWMRVNWKVWGWK